MADHLISSLEAEYEKEKDRWAEETGSHRDDIPIDFEEFAHAKWLQWYLGEDDGRERDT